MEHQLLEVDLSVPLKLHSVLKEVMDMSPAMPLIRGFDLLSLLPNLNFFAITILFWNCRGCCFRLSKALEGIGEGS